MSLAFTAAHGQENSLHNTPAPGSSIPSLERKLEVLIRSQFSVPPEYSITLGTRSKSGVEGFDTLPVTFIYGDKQTTVEFLVSEDGAILARFEKFDVHHLNRTGRNLFTKPATEERDAKLDFLVEFVETAPEKCIDRDIARIR